MKDINKMRLGVIRELKNLRYFLDQLEKGVKRRDEFAISRAYIFLNNLVYHMDNGDLTPTSIELTHALYRPTRKLTLKGVPFGELTY